MVDYEHSDLFYDRSVHKSLRIYNDDESIVFTNSDIYNESFELTESICSEPTLVFGSCEPSMLKFKIANVVTPLTGKWFNVTETLGSNTDKPFVFGRYKVFSDVPTADKKYRDLTLYDILHDILEIDVAYWYNFILPNSDSSVTLLEFRNSLFEYLGIEQEEVTLPNDGMIIRRTIQTNQLFVFDVLRAVCEINGCFGHIGRNNKFTYIFLKEMTEGLYPSRTLFPADNLYPTEAKNAEKLTSATYIGCEYEDFIVSRINKVQIQQEDGDIGVAYGTGNNAYIIQGNFLTYGLSQTALSNVAKNILSEMSIIWYIPAQVEAKGNPCIEVGDGIRLNTKSKSVFTYVLQRTLKGIQALRDSYEANGNELQRELPNNTQAEIMQLKGKSNVLKRSIEETRLEIQDVEKGLFSQIVQTADSLRLEVTERTSVYNEEINTLQGGMDGNIDLSFFSNSESSAIVTTANGKQCIISSSDDPINGSGLVQDISLPSGTYLFSYEWLRNIGLYINANLELLDLTSGEVIYSKDLGEAWPELNVWNKESYQFSIQKTSRIRFEFFYSAPPSYPERANDVHLTNISLHGTAQSVADAITDVKAEMIIQSDQISTKVSKNDVISEINQTAETITINAEKINLNGLVEADEFKSKWAEIETLKVKTADIEEITANEIKALNGEIHTIRTTYISANELQAEVAKLGFVDAESLKANAAEFGLASIGELSAVDAKFNSLNADNITAGTMSVERIDLNGLSSKKIEVNTLTASKRITSAYMNTTTFNCNEFNGRNPSWQTITINGTAYTVLTA